jgi:tripartite ATP-independent transporter DctP family solute receptor
MTTGTGVSSVVPEVTLPQVGFAFNSVKAGLAAYDGALGAFVRAAMEKKGIFGFQYVYDIGMRVITSSSKPIRTPEDLDGFKLRTPGEHVSLDLFAAFGASPTPMTYDQLYTALQTHLVDGQETPYQSIYFGKLYEVQKYLAVSNHQYTAFYLLSNTEVIAGLPPDIKASLMRNAQKYAMLERQDNERLNRTYVQQLKDKGMVFNDIDIAAMRKRLTAYYAKYRSEFGTVAWDALQRAAGATLA